MAVRFILGRAGSGKTHLCLDAIRNQLLENPVEGPSLILFIPEQAAVQAERMLLSTKDLAGASRYHTMSFRRLQQMVLADTGFAGRELVGPLGRQMILQYLLIHHGKELQVLGKVADRPGTAAQIAQSIAEFMEEGLLAPHVSSLAGYVGSTPVSKVSTELLQGKLHDLGLIYQAYLAWLNERNQADPAALLTETADRLAQSSWLHKAEIWVDGFASFSQQQQYTLSRLAQVASSVHIALLLDPETASSLEPPEPYDLFYRTWQTWQQLRKTFTEANVEIEEPILLRSDPLPRFREKPILARIEAQLFETTGQMEPYKPSTKSGPEIEIFAAPSRTAEVEALARKIIDLTRVAPPRSALRYRQVAVLVRDLEPYHEILQAVFAAHEIPFFIDKRRSVSHHPLVELVRALMRLLADDWPIDAVTAMLKTALVPVPRDRGDLVGNYLRAHGIAGWATWCGSDWEYLRRYVGADENPAPPTPGEEQMLNKANQARRILCKLLTPWSELDGIKNKTGRDWAERLYATIERLKVARRLMRWQKLAEIHGGPAGLELGQQHKQVWSLFTQLLDDVVAGLGDQPMTVEEFQTTVEAGLEAFSLPLIPPVVDQVVVGSVDRSRQPDITAAFILGFNEGCFPQRRSTQRLLSDSERDLLTAVTTAGSGAAANVNLLTSKQQLFDERLLAYIALTRASRYIWISYATADESGKKLAPSPYLRALKTVLPNLHEVALADSLTNLSVDQVGTAWQGATGAVLAGRRFCCGDGAADPQESKDSWLQLAHWMNEDLLLAQKVQRVASACDYVNSSPPLPAQARRLFGERLACSVSQLQEYAACPYRYFAHYGLRLQEQIEVEIAAVELGSYYHRILYKLATRVREKGHLLRTVPSELFDSLVNQTTDDELKAIVKELALTGGKQAYLLERAKVDIGSAIRGHLALWRNSKFDPARLEAGFGIDKDFPALTLLTPAGRTAILRGKIDRIDAAAAQGGNTLAVIDYKRSSRYKFALDEAFAGLQVQLIVYMKAALDSAGKDASGNPAAIPGGMYYFNLLPTWEKVTPGDLIDRTKTPDGKMWQLRGLTNSDCLPSFYEGGSDDGWPVPMKFRKDGQLTAASPAASTADFYKIIDHVWKSLGETVDQILDGQFPIIPYKSGSEMPCNYCPYDTLCRFDPRFNGTRPIARSNLKRCLEIVNSEDASQ